MRRRTGAATGPTDEHASYEATEDRQGRGDHLPEQGGGCLEWSHRPNLTTTRQVLNRYAAFRSEKSPPQCEAGSFERLEAGLPRGREDPLEEGSLEGRGVTYSSGPAHKREQIKEAAEANRRRSERSTRVGFFQQWLRKRQLDDYYGTVSLLRYRGEEVFKPQVGDSFWMRFSFAVDVVDRQLLKKSRVLEQVGISGPPICESAYLREMQILDAPVQFVISQLCVRFRGERPEFFEIVDLGENYLAYLKGHEELKTRPLSLHELQHKIRDEMNDRLTRWGLRIDEPMPFTCEEFKREEHVVEPEIVDDILERQFSDKLQRFRSQSEEILGENLPVLPTDFVRYDGWLSEAGKVWRLKAKQRTLQAGLNLISEHTALCRALLERRSLRSSHDVQMAQDHATRVECDERIKKAEFGAAEWTHKLNALLHPAVPKAKPKSQEEKLIAKVKNLEELERTREKLKKETKLSHDVVDDLCDHHRMKILGEEH